MLTFLTVLSVIECSWICCNIGHVTSFLRTCKECIEVVLHINAEVQLQEVQKCSTVYQCLQSVVMLTCIRNPQLTSPTSQCFNVDHTHRLKTKTDVHCIKRCSSYRVENILRLLYKNQSVHAVLRNNRCLLKEGYETHKCYLWAESIIYTVKSCW